MREKNQKAHEKRKIELMEQCFECFAENGLGSVSIRSLLKLIRECIKLYTRSTEPHSAAEAISPFR